MQHRAQLAAVRPYANWEKLRELQAFKLPRTPDLASLLVVFEDGDFESAYPIGTAELERQKRLVKLLVEGVSRGA